MVPFLPVLRRLTHGLTLGVRTIVISPAREVLLVRHSYAAGWHFPGGGVDAGESAEAAGRRELQEEANVTVTGAMLLHGVFFNARFGRRDHVVCYRVPLFTCGPAPAPNREIRAVTFFPLDALPDDLSPGTARRLRELRGETELSELW